MVKNKEESLSKSGVVVDIELSDIVVVRGHGHYLLVKCASFLQYIFYLLCFFSGQLTFTSLQTSTWYRVLNALSWSTLLFSLIANVASTAFDMAVIGWCPYENCGYIDIRGSNDNLSGLSIQPDNPDQFNDLQKFVFTSASLSGTLSYSVMIYVLLKTYHYPLWTKLKDLSNREKLQTSAFKRVVLNPFRDDEELESTAFVEKQSLYFYSIFFFNILIFISSVTIFFILYSQEYNKKDSFLHLFLNIGGLTSQFYSWGCAILSCFIFSKIAYSIQNFCTVKLLKLFNKIAAEKELKENFINSMLKEKLKMKEDVLCIKIQELNQCDDKHFEMLKIVDRWYGFTLKCSLYPYSTWFALHWVLYTLTGFLSLSYAIEYILMELYQNTNPCQHEKSSHCRLILVYILLFSLHHCALFLYPCFRAASVTAARFSLIKKVSKSHWPHVKLAEKQAFLQYLKDENSTFKVSILCANLSFGFELAYLSIFFGLMSVVLKITL